MATMLRRIFVSGLQHHVVGKMGTRTGHVCLEGIPTYRKPRPNVISNPVGTKMWTWKHGSEFRWSTRIARWCGASCPASFSRSITVKVEGGFHRGHGSDGHNGLLSCIHPIARGPDLHEDLAEAANRATDEAYDVLDRSGLEMNPKSRKMKTAVANAAAVLALDAQSEGPRAPHAQFCLGVMLWKGIGLKRYFHARF